MDNFEADDDGSEEASPDPLASESELDDLAAAPHRCGAAEPLAVLPDSKQDEQSDDFEEFEEPFETVFGTQETEEDGPPPVAATVVVRGPVSSASPFAGLPRAALHSRSEPVCALSDVARGAWSRRSWRRPRSSSCGWPRPDRTSRFLRTFLFPLFGILIRER